MALKSSLLFLTLMMPKSTLMQSARQVVELISSIMIFFSDFSQSYLICGRAADRISIFLFLEENRHHSLIL